MEFVFSFLNEGVSPYHAAAAACAVLGYALARRAVRNQEV